MAQAQYRYRGRPPYRPPQAKHVCATPPSAMGAAGPPRFEAEPIGQLIEAQREQGAMVDAEEQRRRMAMWGLDDVPAPQPEPDPITDGFTCFVQMRMAGSVFGKALPATPPDKDRDDPELYMDKVVLHRAVQYGQQYNNATLLPLTQKLMDALARRFADAQAPVMRDFCAALAAHGELEVGRPLPPAEVTSAWSGRRLSGGEAIALTLYEDNIGCGLRAYRVHVEHGAAALLRLGKRARTSRFRAR